MTPPNNQLALVLTKARLVELLLLDVDGVLTDGGLVYTAQGEQTKVFNTLDGHGIKLLQQAGVAVAIISGRDNPALHKRMADLGITHVYAGVHDKKIAAQQLLSQLGLTWSQVAAMGDDWPDLPMLMPAAVAFAPPQAHPEVVSRVDWVTKQASGLGAVREVCDMVLQARGVYDQALQQAMK